LFLTYFYFIVNRLKKDENGFGSDRDDVVKLDEEEFPTLS